MSLAKENKWFDYEAYSHRLKRVTLPEKLKCNRCGKIRGIGAYSKRQILDLKSAIARNKRVNFSEGAVSCQKCTGGQICEMTCVLCDKTKGLESFSKAQRKDPDTAQCYNCLQGNLDANPVDESGDTFDDASTALGSQAYDYGSNTMNKMAGSSRFTGGSPDDSDEEDDAVRRGWIEPKRASTRATGTSLNGNSAAFSSSAMRNGSGGRGTAGDNVSGGSANSSVAGKSIHAAWAAYGVTPKSTYAGSVGSNGQEKSGGKFAKTKDEGPRFTQQTAPRMQAPATEGATLDSDSSEDEEDPNDYL